MGDGYGGGYNGDKDCNSDKGIGYDDDGLVCDSGKDHDEDNCDDNDNNYKDY